MNALKRAIRTFLQAWSGSMISLWVLSGVDADGFTGVSDLAAIGKMVLGACFAGFIAVVTFIHNATEDAGIVAPLLKDANT